VVGAYFRDHIEQGWCAEVAARGDVEVLAHVMDDWLPGFWLGSERAHLDVVIDAPDVPRKDNGLLMVYFGDRVTRRPEEYARTN